MPVAARWRLGRLKYFIRRTFFSLQGGRARGEFEAPSVRQIETRLQHNLHEMVRRYWYAVD